VCALDAWGWESYPGQQKLWIIESKLELDFAILTVNAEAFNILNSWFNGGVELSAEFGD
jgi:hypothetical protein